MTSISGSFGGSSASGGSVSTNGATMGYSSPIGSAEVTFSNTGYSIDVVAGAPVGPYAGASYSQDLETGEVSYSGTVRRQGFWVQWWPSGFPNGNSTAEAPHGMHSEFT
jgi:hypothetical protein